MPTMLALETKARNFPILGLPVAFNNVSEIQLKTPEIASNGEYGISLIRRFAKFHSHREN